jgi:NADPH-dependent 2,4-dienoyl-CoA reductase/sulfur reductase-like enzyme/rhodanese-related sulfurtransferase
MPQNVITIGANALGSKAASRFKRLEPESRVIMVDLDPLASYAGSCIPYFISDHLAAAEGVRETYWRVVRDESFYREVQGVELLAHTRALRVERNEKVVVVQNLDTGNQDALPYDQLVIATGKRPVRQSLPGLDLEGVCSIYSLKDAVIVRDRIARGHVARLVVVGGGFTGLQIAEAVVAKWGINTTVVEAANQLLPDSISENMAQMVKHHLERKGIGFWLGEKAIRIEGNGSAQRLITDKRALQADLVILATGIEPNSDLAREAGLDISPRGTIIVNERMQTSDPSIYAGGDCVELTNFITRKPDYFPLESLAFRQGRVIGSNLAGGSAVFEGAVGNRAMKLFDISVASAGLSVQVAQREGLDAASAMVAQLDRANFWPGNDIMFLELVVEKKTGRVLGIQGLGNLSDAMVGHVNAVASILRYGPITVADISKLEFSHSPPFSCNLDIVNTLGNTAENIVLREIPVMHADEFKRVWRDIEKGEWLVLDTRHPHEVEPFLKKYPRYWKNIPLTELLARKDEIPRDKKFVLVCKTGLRSYDYQLILDHAGIKDSYSLQGGMIYIDKWGLDLTEKDA